MKAILQYIQYLICTMKTDNKLGEMFGNCFYLKLHVLSFFHLTNKNN